VPSSGIVVTNGNSDGLKSILTYDPIVTQGFSVPRAASGPPGGGVPKSPELVAPTPAPIGMSPPPPKPPDVLTQHSSGSTVLHPATSTTRTEAIETNSVRMG
jgi:hypothetical protein